MNKYVYMVRRSWYDEYHVFGIYETADAAREDMQKYFDERTKDCSINLTYRWKNKKTAGEYFFSALSDKEYQSGEFKIVRIPLNKWLED